MIVVKARLNAGSIERRYELPSNPDAVDREAFQRWLLGVIPTADERQQHGPVELYMEDWPDGR